MERVDSISIRFRSNAVRRCGTFSVGDTRAARTPVISGAWSESRNPPKTPDAAIAATVP